MTDSLVVTFKADKAATLTKLDLRLGAIRGTTPKFKVSLQKVDADGEPKK